MCVQRSLGHCKAMLMPVRSLDKHAVTHSQSVTPRMLPPSVLLGSPSWANEANKPWNRGGGQQKHQHTGPGYQPMWV